MAEPEEVEDEDRQGSNKEAICVEDDPSEPDDDCPKIYNMGGNAEMVLNKGVGNNYVIITQTRTIVGLVTQSFVGKELCDDSYPATYCNDTYSPVSLLFILCGPLAFTPC